MKQRGMVTIIGVLTLLAGLFQPLAQPAYALETNLIANASVETASSDSSTPEGWSRGNWGTNSVSFSYDSAGHTGARSVKVQMSSYTDGDAKWYFTPVAVTPGQRYDFSDYYKSNVTTQLIAQFDDGAGSYDYAEMATIGASSDWALAKASVTVPSGMKHLTVFHLIDSVGVLSLDDASLTAAASASTPTVTITSPAAGATVSGTTRLAATASDANGVLGVQFKVDGVAVGAEITNTPYQTDWNTAALSNGSHTVTATARNTQGVFATDSRVVTVTNTTGNLVPNPSLEAADPLDSSEPLNWRTDSWGTNMATFAYLSTGAHSGSRAVQTRVTSYTDGDAKWYFNPIAVSPGGLYRFSDYYKATSQTEVVAAFTLSDGSAVYQTVGLPEPTSSWGQFSTTFTVPKNAASMTMLHILRSKGTLTLDDASLQPYTPTGFNRALVSLTFDDGYASTYTNGLPLLKKHGLVSTQFIISGAVGTPEYMTIAQVKALAAAGHEIGSHSVTHPDMTKLTKNQFDKELTNSKTKLQQWTGKTVTDFAFPEGRYNQAIVTDAKPLYTSTRSIEAGLNSKDMFNPYDIKVQNIDATTTAGQVADWVAQAQATKTWLVLVYHSVDTDTTGEFNTTPASLDTQLAAIQSSGIPVLTVQQAITEITPQL